ncbi:MAG: type III-A CRISPR-associated RAMP protein Csm3 [Magnetococcales bacterium]|nr:type III-A CRISPR-associated RAMP protein Csm3 [Magnetococcales bacterium]
MKLTRIQEITGTIEVVTGLHIGGGGVEMHIGGSDNPVIRHPHTNEPYIPGSSLKGKIRSMLEWRAGLATLNNGGPMCYGKLNSAPDKNAALRILKLFGVSGGDSLTPAQAEEVGPSRLAFRDCPLQRTWVEKIRQKNLPLTETKMENTIDRVRGVAEHPRNTERVPAGATFDFRLAVKVIDDEALLDELFIGLKLLEMDSLGGSGSRGYGRVIFRLAEEDQQRLDHAKPW